MCQIVWVCLIIYCTEISLSWYSLLPFHINWARRNFTNTAEACELRDNERIHIDLDLHNMWPITRTAACVQRLARRTINLLRLLSKGDSLHIYFVSLKLRYRIALTAVYIRTSANHNNHNPFKIKVKQTIPATRDKKAKTRKEVYLFNQIYTLPYPHISGVQGGKQRN